MSKNPYEISIGRGVQDFHRPEVAKRYFVITNGTCTEADYFHWLNDCAYDNIEVYTKKGMSLNRMLEAVEEAKEASEEYDGIVIVLDIDDRLDGKTSKKKLEKFLKRTKDLGAEICLSNESFEVWLIAHKITVPAGAGDRKKASKLALELGLLDQENEKSIPKGALKPSEIGRAVNEANRLRKLHKNILKRKPGTDVDEVVRKVRLKS